MKKINVRPVWLRGALISAAMVAGGTTAFAIVVSPSLVDVLETPRAVHHTQAAMEAGGFPFAFVEGDEFFETIFNAVDGVGANVGDGSRFTRVPRADLDNGVDAWLNHSPPRATGPNGQACNECHNRPFGTFAGSSATAVHRDPMRNGLLGEFIRRDTPHLAGAGGLQRLAEEMTEDLHFIRASAAAQACASGLMKKKGLLTKGVNFGKIKAIPSGGPCVATFDTSQVVGVDSDLVVKPFQWKGSDATIRIFNRGAMHNELGMQPVELTGDGVDGDGDGVVDEGTIGDITGLTIYLAGQPRPTTRIELASLGIIDPLTHTEKVDIKQGGKVFRQVGCAKCHKPALKLIDPIFSEPSQNPNYRDNGTFPAGQPALVVANAITFDLTADLPDNVINEGLFNEFRLGDFEANLHGEAIVRLFGDLKRHDMGPGLAETIDEVGTGASVWLTKELWGVGSTEPYLHDGRATTLTEAILEHGGEGLASRDAFAIRPLADQAALLAYLNNLVLFKAPED